MLKHCHLVIFLLFSSLLFAQEKINQFDASGKRHGLWRKKFDGTEQIRYEGSFDHGKEKGLFKFYKEGHEEYPAATKNFIDKTGAAEVKFYTSEGKLISEGNMRGEQRQGKWTYYHMGTDQIMMIENYVDDVLQGKKIVYYPDGKVAEESTYKNDIKHGINKIYAESGNLIKEFTYVNGELHGPVKYYDNEGNLESAGQYKNNLRDGIWKYYKNGKVSYTKKFPEALSERNKS